MALRFSDNGYNVYAHTTGYGVGITTDTGTPLVIDNAGSLRISNPTFATLYVNCTKDATPHHQMESGFLRAQWRYVDAAYTSLDAYLFLAFHQSVADITGTTESFKGVALRLNGTQIQLIICSATSGMQNTITAHQSTSLTAISGGSIYSIAAEFLYSVSFGGTQVKAWMNASATLPERVDTHQLLHTFTESAPGALYCGEAARSTKVTSADNVKIMVDRVRRETLS